MKKNYLALLLLFSTMSLTSCGDEPSVNPSSIVTSSVTSTGTSTSTKRELSFKKGQVNGKYVLKTYKDKPTNVDDPSFSVFKVSISRGENDINIFKEDFTATDSDKSNLQAVSLITSLKGETIVIDGKNTRVPYVNATTEAVTLTASDTYIIIRVAFEGTLSENSKIFYKGNEITA